MGVAAYNRGTRLLAKQTSEALPSVEAVLINDLNALPKEEGAPVPFGPIHFTPGHNGWWAVCPTTGFGYWHKTLRKAVRSLRVSIVSVEMVAGKVTYVSIPSS